MITKKEIRDTWRYQVGINRITDELINKARYNLGMEGEWNPTQKQIVDTAYELQLNKN